MPFDFAPSPLQAPGGDVVWFRFPVVDAERSTRVPKRRPCLVLDVFTRGERRFAQIVYGTSAKTAANRGYEIVVKQPAGCAAAGLDRPTRFVGSRRLIVSLDHVGFDTDRATGSPIIGRLDAPLLARMNAARARMLAEAHRCRTNRRRG